MTAEVIAFLKNEAFDPDHVEAMGHAFDKAVARLADSKIEVVRELLAGRIVAIAKTGERDPNVLCDEALIALGIFE